MSRSKASSLALRAVSGAIAPVAFVDPGAGRGSADRLGMAVQLTTLPWLGFVPGDVASAPPVAVARLAGQLGLDPGHFRGMGNGLRLARTT